MGGKFARLDLGRMMEANVACPTPCEVGEITPTASRGQKSREREHVLLEEMRKKISVRQPLATISRRAARFAASCVPNSTTAFPARRLGPFPRGGGNVLVMGKKNVTLDPEKSCIYIFIAYVL